MRRRRDDLAVGVEDEVPYDQTGMIGEETPPLAPDAPTSGGGMDLGALGQEQGMGEMPLGSLAPTDPAIGQDDMMMEESPEEMMTPEEIEVEQMAAALEDPSVPPEQKAQIEQMLALAARRQLAGFGGQ